MTLSACIRRHASRAALAAAVLALTTPLLAASAYAQAAPDALTIAGSYKTPRTSWGKPDFQGVWSNASVTRMERPAGLPLIINRQQADKIEGGALFNQRVADKSNTFVDPNAPPPEKGKPLPGVGNYDVAYTDPGSKVATINGEMRSSYVTFPEDGRIPAMTDEGKALRAAAGNTRRRGTGYDNPEERGLSERCIIIGTGGPPLGNYLYNNNLQIIETPDNVVLETEMIHDVRIARIGAEHRKDGVAPWMGDTVAHWEGDTLVMETNHINPEQQGAVFLSKEGKITEKFTRISESQVLYEFEVNDPKVYASVWRGQMPLNKISGQVYEYACHEGNYGLQDILKGGRTDDLKGVNHTGGGSRGE